MILLGLILLLASCNFSQAPQPGDVGRTTAMQVGLLGEYFPDPGLSGDHLSRVDPRVAFDWGNTSPIIGLRPGNFSARWSGFLQAKYGEETTFYLDAKGQAKLWLDGFAVANGGKLWLEAGRKYAVRLEFQKTSEEAALELSWESASLPKAVIEPLQFYTPKTFDDAIQTAAPNQAPRGQNFLVNPGFESGAGSWNLASGTYNLVTPGRSGSGSAARVTNWAWVQQDLPSNFVEGGATLNIEGWGRSLSGAACVLGVSGQTLASVSYERTISFTASTWTRQTATLALPGDAAWAVVSLRGNAGECQFDDLSVSIGTALEAQTPSTNVLTNAGFESDQANWVRTGGSSRVATPGRSGAGKALGVSGFAWVQQNVSVGSIFQGQNYILTGWARAATGGTCTIGISGNTTINNSFAQTLTFTNTNWEQKSLMLTIPTSLSWVAVYMTSTTPECLFDDLALGQNPGGLRATYFDNIDLTGTQATRIDPSINLNWGTAAPIAGIAPTTYSVRWTGQIAAPTTGTHTFYLTHTDGARLMVNGQVLVNNWKDQASITDSATITLQANVRYDVRLEYYRNSTNPGQIRLEWQSGYLSRQDVFSDRLFSSGSNTERALRTLTQSSFFASTNLILDNQNAVVSLDEKGRAGIIASELTNDNVVLAGVNGEQIEFLYRFYRSSNNLIFSNLKAGRSVDLGVGSTYIDSTNSITSEKLNELATKMIPVALAHFTASIPIGSSSIRTQQEVSSQLISDFVLCSDIGLSSLPFPKPDNCDGECDVAAKNLTKAYCGFTGNLVDTAAAILLIKYPVGNPGALWNIWQLAGWGIRKAAEKVVPALGGGATFIDLAKNGFTGSDAIKSAQEGYEECLRNRARRLNFPQTGYLTCNLLQVRYFPPGSAGWAASTTLLSGESITLNSVSYNGIVANGEDATWTTTTGSITVDPANRWRATFTASRTGNPAIVTARSIRDPNWIATFSVTVRKITAILCWGSFCGAGADVSPNVAIPITINIQNDGTYSGGLVDGTLNQKTVTSPNPPCHVAGQQPNRGTKVVEGISVADPSVRTTYTITSYSNACP